MRRQLAVLVSALLLFACKPSSKPKPPAMGPDVAVSAVIVNDGGLDHPLDSHEHQVAVGFDGTNYLVVWAQPGGATLDDLWAARLTASGEPVGAPFPISRAFGDQQTPAVAFDGENWLVVFQDHRVGQYYNIYGARVRAADGTVLDPDGLPIAIQSDNQASPAVAFDGTGFLVAWADRRTVSRWDIYATRLTRDAVVLDPDGIVIAAAPRGQVNPAIAWDGANYLVAWQDVRLGGDYDIRAARVTPAGALLDVGGVVVSGGASNETCPAVAFDGQTFIVAWEDLRGGSGAPAVYAARVTSAGGVLDASGIPVTPSAGAGTRPAVAFDGAYTLVAWHDPSSVPTTVQGARLDDAGAVVDPAAFLIASGSGAESLAVASDRAGRALVAYDAIDPASGAVRVRARALTDWALLSVEKAGRGGGVVASTPEGIDCGAACSSRFDAPTEVSLVATPDGDSAFGGWSGACAGTEACTVTTDVARSVTATFLPLHALSVTFGSAIAGTVTSEPAGIQCGDACSSRFAEGTAVELAAQGIPGESVFSGWAGDCGPSATIADPDAEGRCAAVMDGPRSVTATFVRAHTITLRTSGTGTGTVLLGGTSCASGGSCAVDVVAGSTVTIAAAASAGSVFKSWMGCYAVAGAPSTCTLPVGAPKTVTAKFEPSTIALTAVTGGTGAGTVTGAGLACTTGSSAGCTAAVENPADASGYTTVTLTATARPGSVFKSWSGCTAVPGAPSTCTVLVSSARTVTAKFEPGTIALSAVTSGTGAGTITGGGLACTSGSSAGCAAAVENPADSAGYTTVTLTGTPSPGSVLKTWSGCTPVPGAPSTCTVLVSSAKTVTARFDPATVPLHAVTSGTGSGTVTGAGLACTTGSTAGCTTAVENPPFTTAYASVILTAAASPGSVFKTWTGCTAVAGFTCTVSASPGKTVTAKFEPAGIPLTAVTSGTGAGTVTGAGLACSSGSSAGCTTLVGNPEATGAYEVVTLTATASPGSVFKTWTGCTAIAGTNTCTVTVSSAKSVTAKFEPSTVPLTAVTSGTGAGTVTGAGLACTTGSAAGCTTVVENPENTSAYTTVTLTATPSAGSVFKSWTGCTAVVGTNTCTLAVSSAKSVTAKFEPDAVPLTAATSGTGAGTVTGAGLSCSTGSTEGCTTLVGNPGNTSAYQTVTLTATSDAGSVFKTWTGCTAIAGTNTCTVTVSSAKSVTAKFEPSTIPLAASTVGTGAGTVTGVGLACTTGSTEGCRADVANPPNTGAYTIATLTATASTGSVFKSWTGCTAVAGTNTCTITVNTAKSVTAKFEPSTIPLTVVTSGTGAGTVTGAGAVAAAGIACSTGASEGCTVAVENPDDTSGYATVTLTAAASDGSTFSRWSGCTPVSGAPQSCTVTVSTARTVTATFVAP